MKRKEYEQIMQELSGRAIEHEYHSFTETVETESISVVPLQEAFDILRKHVDREEAGVRINIRKANIVVRGRKE
jgi:hypothetical protein